jgi:hypothetical protein
MIALSACLLWFACSKEETRSVFSEDRGWPEQFGFGRPASTREIDSLNIDVNPQGIGLPPGDGTVANGKMIFQSKCERCHGISGRGGPFGSLVAERDTTSDKDGRREKTIGDYWPYATTVYDYIHRAMPYDQPGSLKPDDVYSLTAYLLYSNGIIDSLVTIDASNLPLVVMPAQKLFVNDDRIDGPEIR